MLTRYSLCLLLVFLIFVDVAQRASAIDKAPSTAYTIRLAADGHALFPIITSARPSERVRRSAKTLADYLGRISGATFEVTAGDGRTGLAIGLPGDFPDLKLQGQWDAKDPLRREDYLLRSHGKGLLLIGATDLAVEHAVWDLLHRLGHRQFFPGELWEIVPRAKNLAIAVDSLEHPAFLSRDVGYGYGPWDGRRQPYNDWCARNRMNAGNGEPPLLDSGHIYVKIYSDLKKEFDKHPEYLALVNGKRVAEGEVKFCISNPDLRKLVAQYAVDHFARNPAATSMSLEPSDGLGWCECKQCRDMGSVSDRVITLCNESAAAVRAKYGPQKLFSTYAYAEHAPPPTIKVHPQVVVNVATAMTSGDFTTDQLIDGWRKQGAQLGIREYYGVFPWDHDLPGKCRLADLEYLRTSIPRFHQQGARFLVAESSDNWGVAGLGYYTMARMLWDVREAKNIQTLKDDFLDKVFGTARKPMAEFYRLIDASSSPRISSDLLGRMYRQLDEGRKLTDDPTVRTRIDHLTLYARCVELYADYAYAEGKERQLAFERLLRFTYRIRHTGMVHSLGFWRGLPYEDPSVKLPPGGGYEVPEGRDPWKENKPVAAGELQDLLAAGIARNRLSDFTPVSFSTELTPATPLGLPKVPLGNAGLYFRDRSTFYTWATQTPAPLPVTVKAGLIYQNVGPARLVLLSAGSTAPTGRISVPPEQKEHKISLQPRAAGLHKIELSDRTGGTMLSWPEGTEWTIPAGPTDATDLYSRWTLYFYVPKGTKVVAGYADGVGDLFDASGKKAHTFANRPDYFSVPVGPAQDGRLWKLSNSLGRRILLTVPPYLARDARELLLPAEVVRADAAK